MLKLLKDKEIKEFEAGLAELGDAEFTERAEQLIWLSAYADNNPRSKYHWQADACYDEAVRRGKPELYKTAWERASDSCG